MGSGEHHKHQMEKVLILKQTFCVETLYSITLKIHTELSPAPAHGPPLRRTSRPPERKGRGKEREGW